MTDAKSDIATNPDAVRWRNEAVRRSADIVRAYFGAHGQLCVEDILRLLVEEPPGPDPTDAPSDPASPANQP